MMMEAMKNWWGGLSTRERWLVGVAGALAVAVLGWALGRPAVAAFLDLESRHRAAIERDARRTGADRRRLAAGRKRKPRRLGVERLGARCADRSLGRDRQKSGGDHQRAYGAAAGRDGPDPHAARHARTR